MRNERYRKNAISVRERHNERKNEVYSNPDVLLEYSHNNVTFKACEAATYAQQFDRMVGRRRRFHPRSETGCLRL